MEKIFKKSLALMVSAALCLTAFVGCLTVNAEATATPTYTITAQNGKAGDTVKVKVDGTNLTSVCGQQVFINIPAALTIASVKDNAGKAYVNVADVAKGEAFDYSVVTTETTKQVRFADIINFDTLTTAEFHIVFELIIPDTAAVGAKYEIAFDTATMFADINENAIGITVTPKTITVQAAQPACEHVWEFVSAIPATADAEGSITLKCSACEETKTETVSYYANYKAAYTAADYDAEICLLFAARKDRLAEQGNYSDAYMLFSRESASGAVVTATNIADTTDTTNGSNNRPCKTWSYPVRSTQLTDAVTTTVFVCVNDVWYNGTETTFSVETYALSVLPSVAESEQRLIANMLTYGAKMQIFKSYKTDSLADANLGGYASLVTTTTPAINNTIVDNHDATTDVYINKFNFDMASRTTANFFFRSDRYTGENKSDYTVVVSWTDKDNVAKSISYYPESNADAQYTYGPELLSDGSVRENRYTFTFDSFKSIDYRRPFTIEIYDGETEVSHGYTANFESLIAVGIANGSFGDAEIAAYNAMMNYGDASVSHFVG